MMLPIPDRLKNGGVDQTVPANMKLGARLQNGLRRLVQLYGLRRMKESLWNREFSNGRWDCLETTTGDFVYAAIAKYARHGSILDLGCGSGSTGNELDENAYSVYTGVDISQSAIQKATIRTVKNSRVRKNTYIQSDILTYEPARRYDVILFRDSIYYVPVHKVAALLTRYSHHLTERGVFIIRNDPAAREFAEVVENAFDVVERQVSDGSRTLIVAVPIGRPPVSIQIEAEGRSTVRH